MEAGDSFQIQRLVIIKQVYCIMVAYFNTYAFCYFALVDESDPAENGISSVTAVVTEVDDFDQCSITIDKQALSADDSVHVDG